MDPNLPVLNVRTLREVVEGNRWERDFAGKLLILFGGLALMLTLVGLHGLVAFTVRQRTREVGIRIALGASRRDVLELFGRDTLRMAGIGIGVGMLLASGTVTVLMQLVNGLKPADAVAVVAVAALLIGAALVTTMIAARRATGVDPVAAIRAE